MQYRLKSFDSLRRLGRTEVVLTAAILASLINTARLNGLDPQTWLGDIIERIVPGELNRPGFPGDLIS